MIVYSPLDGEVLTTQIRSRPRCCFLMTQLGNPDPEGVEAIRRSVSDVCRDGGYEVIDARMHVTGRDFLLKIWRMIASTPFAVGVCHEEIPFSTQANIYYELGVAQALEKETLLVKSPGARLPSDFVRTEYVEFAAFLITGEKGLRGKARALLEPAGLDGRAKNSVEQLAAAF